MITETSIHVEFGNNNHSPQVREVEGPIPASSKKEISVKNKQKILIK